MHMVKKGQLRCHGGKPIFAADQFYSLAFCTLINMAHVFDQPTLLRQNRPERFV